MTNQLFEKIYYSCNVKPLFEKILREADETSVFTINETNEDKLLSDYDLKTKYKSYLKNFQGKIFTNKSTKLPIKVSSDSISELLRKHRTRDRIISWQYLNIFIENSITVPDAIQNDYKNRAEIENAKLFYYQCVINNTLYKITLTLRKSINDIDKLRYYSLENISEEVIDKK